MKQLYTPITLHQLFTRAQLTIFALTFTICSMIFLVISTYTMNTFAKNSLQSLSAALNERIQPAVVFNDQITLNEILSEHTQRYSIRSIEVRSPKQTRIAFIEQQGLEHFSIQALLDYLFFNHPVRLSIDHDQQNYGELVVYGNSSDLVSFFYKIVLGLIFGFILLLIAVFWSINSIYQYLMQSLSSIVSSAQEISAQKNYKLRVSSSDIQELHELSYAFNGLLNEIEQSHKNLLVENHKLQFQSQYDNLTQLPNRNYFYETLFKLFTQPSATAAVFFLDINNFNQINNQFGHLTGDNILRDSSHCLIQILPSHAFVARLGGDEFAVILTGSHSTAELEDYCQKIHACYTSTFKYEQQQVSLNVSIGVALIEYAKTPENLIADVDRAMLKAKRDHSKWYISPQSNNKQVPYA
ncbi:diguanylate cyclase domain-containing protein [Acinetobacter sp. YH01012]|uniref:diguanylate cyclase domain-containing protein n=1 Tax=Acinetobacter sp. YH01012 TaxID=2601028 RepID=UPI0015D39A08|nr:diguanylate cyclase [Acinetobacter sp. YH01012]